MAEDFHSLRTAPLPSQTECLNTCLWIISLPCLKRLTHRSGKIEQYSSSPDASISRLPVSNSSAYNLSLYQASNFEDIGHLVSLKMTLVEALRPVFARWTDTIVGREGLADGETLTLDDMRYSTEKFDRNRKTTFVHS